MPLHLGVCCYPHGSQWFMPLWIHELIWFLPLANGTLANVKKARDWKQSGYVYWSTVSSNDQACEGGHFRPSSSHQAIRWQKNWPAKLSSNCHPLESWANSSLKVLRLACYARIDHRDATSLKTLIETFRSRMANMLSHLSTLIDWQCFLGGLSSGELEDQINRGENRDLLAIHANNTGWSSGKVYATYFLSFFLHYQSDEGQWIRKAKLLKCNVRQKK